MAGFVNKSLKEKHTARLMAVQLAYSAQLSGKMPDAHSMQQLALSLKDADEQNDLQPVFTDKPHAPTLQKLLTAYAEHHEVLAQMASETLHDDWQPGRVNPLLLIILKYAILELERHSELATAIIIDEYTSIAARLLDARDVDFLHATIKQMAEKMRG